MRRTFGKRKKKTYSAKTRRGEGAMGLQTLVGRLGPDRLWSASYLPPLVGFRGIDFTAWGFCLALISLRGGLVATWLLDPLR